MADARAFGLEEELIAEIEQAERGEDEQEIGIWPSNWNAVLAFASIMSQWRVAPMPTGRLHYIGLDYAGVRAGLECAGHAITPDLWADMLVMEAAARSAANGSSE